MPHANTTIHTLYILQSKYADLDHRLDELANLYQQGDYLILLDEAIAAVHYPRIANFLNVAVLEEDAYLVQDYPAIDRLSYTEFADCIEQANMVVTWK